MPEHGQYELRSVIILTVGAEACRSEATAHRHAVANLLPPCLASILSTLIGLTSTASLGVGGVVRIFCVAVAGLDPSRWERVVAEERPRAVAGTGVDAVIRARRAK